MTATRLFEEALATSDGTAGPILHNLGNCAYRRGQLAEAILWYRRALLRVPRDPETTFNLRLAEQRLSLDQPTQRPLVDELRAAADALTANELLAIVVLLLGSGLCGLVLAPRSWRGWRRLFLACVLLGVGLGVCLVHDRSTDALDGIVLAGQIAVRPEPHDGVPSTLDLKAGELVRVLERSKRWLRIEHPRGGGWTRRTGVGLVE